MPAVHDHDRGVRRRQAELGRHSLGRRVGLEVQPPVREPVAGREVPDPPGVRGVFRADDAQADAEPDQDRAAQQVGTEDEVAERRITVHQVPELADRDREHLARVQGHRGVVGALAGQQAELAEEPAAAVDGDDAFLGRPVPLDRRHLPGQDDEEVAVPVALGEQDIPGRVTRCRPCAASAAIWASLSRGYAPCRSGVSPAASSDEGFVDIAPAPVLARLERLDDRVTVREGAGPGMTEPRRVAAAPMLTGDRSAAHQQTR
jgi:hypothetical protein